MNEVAIRRAGMEDLPAVLALLGEVDDLHREALPWLFRQVEEPATTDFLEEYVSEPDRNMLLATISGGALAGVLYMYLRKPRAVPIVKPTTVAEIDTLAVSRAARRQGVGTALVRAALQWAVDNGATRTELGVYEFNEAARAFWASAGFHTLSRRLVAHSASVNAGGSEVLRAP